MATETTRPGEQAAVPPPVARWAREEYGIWLQAAAVPLPAGVDTVYRPLANGGAATLVRPGLSDGRLREIVQRIAGRVAAAEEAGR